MKYKAGDKVRIKSWERMENEYGLNLINDIPCRHVFTQEMVGWCERVMTIDSISVDNYDGDGYNMKEDYGEYFWSDDMIEGLVESSSEKGQMLLLLLKSQKCRRKILISDISLFLIQMVIERWLAALLKRH